jgi:monoamine oxidase
MLPITKPSKDVETFDPHHLFDSRPTFSHVTTTTEPSRIIATAGQVGVDTNGVVPTDYDAQIALAFSNLRRALEAAGASVKNIMKLTYYIVNYDFYGRRYFKHLYEFLDGYHPATTLIPVAALARPEFLFEVEALATVRQAPVQKVDVVVVGAGISGLQAAYDIQKAGLSCVVLEARDRVGGKTLSVDLLDEGKVVDLGAAWINSTNQSRMFAMTKEFGLKTVVQNTVGDAIMHDLDGSVSSFPYGGLPKVILRFYLLTQRIIRSLIYELEIVSNRRCRWYAIYS